MHSVLVAFIVLLHGASASKHRHSRDTHNVVDDLFDDSMITSRLDDNARRIFALEQQQHAHREDVRDTIDRTFSTAQQKHDERIVDYTKKLQVITDSVHRVLADVQEKRSAVENELKAHSTALTEETNAMRTLVTDVCPGMVDAIDRFTHGQHRLTSVDDLHTHINNLSEQMQSHAHQTQLQLDSLSWWINALVFVAAVTSVIILILIAVVYEISVHAPHAG